MSDVDETTTVEAEAVETTDAPDAAPANASPEAEVEAEPVAETEAGPVAEAAEPVAEAEPVTETEDVPEAEAVAEPEAEAVPEPVAIPMPARVAKVFLCERGHRTTVLWSEPTTCQARPFRSGPVCGRQLYSIGELPEQVQKALNPLKASKKSSKK